MAGAAEAAHALTTQRQRLDTLWSQVRIAPPQSDREVSQLHSGDTFKATCRVFLGQLRPDEVTVELCYGTADSQGQIPHPAFFPMTAAGDTSGGWSSYTLTIPCPASGRFGMSARGVPSGTQWRSVSPPYIAWAGAAG